MNRSLAWHLALRYLRGKRTANAAPVLSRISMVAIAVGSGAMIVLFSVFNGFEGLIKDLYTSFYPEMKISPVRGKFFSLDSTDISKITHIPGVLHLTRVLEDQVLINSGEEQSAVILKGIDHDYYDVNDIRPYIIDGLDSVSTLSPGAIVGVHIADKMNLDVNNVFTRIRLYYPNARDANPVLNPESAFQTLVLKPNGVFQVHTDFDDKYIIAPLSLVQSLFQEKGAYSSLELSLQKGADPQAVQQQLKSIVGNQYKVQTRYEQNKTLYMVMRTEKWAVYAILLLVLLIASFNMVGALSLLIVEKQKDISILKAMGMQRGTIRRIFMLEGILWSLTGGTVGLLLGTMLCVGQKYFHWVKMGDGFIISSYPVHMQFGDFVLVIVTLIVVGILASWYPAWRATKAEILDLKTT